MRVQRELELKEIRELYKEESTFDEEQRIEEAQLVDPVDLDLSSIRSALPYILDP